MTSAELHDKFVILIRSIMDNHPAWDLNSILNTDIEYFDDVLFDKKKATSNKVVSMESWFKEIKKGG